MSIIGSTVFDDLIYFAANDGTHQQELWTYDPVGEAAALAADINPSGKGRPREMTVYDDRLFFRANDGTHGEELWVYDRATQTAEMVADLNPGVARSRPEWLTVYDGKLYFSADGGTTGRELYVYDAATDRLGLAADVRPGDSGSSSTPQWLAVYGEMLYFQADDGNGSSGAELWAFDGTDARRVRDIRPGGDSSSPTGLTVYNGKLYFSAGTDATGGELYVYDHAEAPRRASPQFGSPSTSNRGSSAALLRSCAFTTGVSTSERRSSMSEQNFGPSTEPTRPASPTSVQAPPAAASEGTRVTGHTRQRYRSCCHVHRSLLSTQGARGREPQIARIESKSRANAVRQKQHSDREFWSAMTVIRLVAAQHNVINRLSSVTI